MGPAEVDTIDEAILARLQGDARDVTMASIAEDLGVAASTVASRLSRLENEGVITGYWPAVDYEAIGYDQHLQITGTLVEDGEDALDAILSIDGVIGVQRLMSDEANVVVQVVGRSQDDIEDGAAQLGDLGVEIRRTELVEECRRRPGDVFRSDGRGDE